MTAAPLRPRKSLAVSPRARRVAFGGLKGGAGKTATATNLAAAAVERGFRVLLANTDPQRTAIIWARTGGPRGYAVPNTADLSDLKTRLSDGEGYDLTFIDCPPTLQDAQRYALALADVALILAAPDDDSLWTIYGNPHVPEAPKSVDLVREAQRTINPALRAFVLLAIKPNTKIANGARADLLRVKNALPLFAADIRRSAEFPKARRLGCGVTTLDPESNASQDIGRVLDELLTVLGLPLRRG